MAIDKPNQFPWKLYDMLDAAERRNDEHVISWIRDGTAFKVHNRELFIEEYMKKMFNQTKFKSFQRQLNLWGFERVQSGPDKGSYYHALFTRGNRECCQRLTRVRLKGVVEKTTIHGGDSSSLQPESPTSAAGSTSVPPAASPWHASAVEETRGIAAGLPLAATAASSSLAVAAPSATSDALDAARRRREAISAAAAELSRTPLSAAAFDASLQMSSQHHRTEILQHLANQRRNSSTMEAAAAAAASRSDVSLVVGAPIYASADSSNLAVNGLLQRELANHEQQQQLLLQQRQLQQHQQQQTQEDQRPREHHEGEHEGQQQRQLDESGSQRSSSDQMAALLSVSAERRREEELALLLALANPRGVSYM